MMPSVQRLRVYVWRYRWRYLAGAVCLFVTATLAMSVPYLLKRAINVIEQGQPFRQVTILAVSIVAIAAVQAVARTFSRALIFNVGRDIEYDLRNDLFQHLQGLSPSFYRTQRTGDLMSRLVNDVTAVRMLLGPAILNLVNTPIYYVYAVSIMLSLDATLTLLALLPFPLLLILVKRYSRQLMEGTVRVQERLAEMSSLVQENLSGIEVIQSYVAEDAQTLRFAEVNRRFLDESVELASVRGRMFPVMKLAASLGTLVVLWYGGARVVSGQLSLGDLVAFIAYLALLAWPTMALGWMLSILQRGRAALRRLEHVFAAVPEIGDAPDAEPLAEVRGRIEFRDVDFAYATPGNGHQVLDGISFTIEPGQQLALVGRTGAGKSSIVQLLARLADPSAGTILLDGRDIRTVPLRQLRRCVGFVPQDPFLFSDTIRDNVGFPLDVPDEHQVRRAVRAACIADEIETFRFGYDTVIGERGITLSGGQRQRLTLARAIAADPTVLVLDDALSSVDVRTERRIQEALREVCRGRTSIVIAHRISSIQHADLIAVVDEGRIVELGDHGTLLARDGIYAELFRQQSLEEEIADL
jgi:ATP-binding cassette subfamily B multidrug efflux pump